MIVTAVAVLLAASCVVGAIAEARWRQKRGIDYPWWPELPFPGTFRHPSEDDE